jgi:transcriptional regulator with PAS, ATPase and Fis domain
MLDLYPRASAGMCEPAGEGIATAAGAAHELPTLNLSELERLAIREALLRYASVAKAAQVLGIGCSTLYRKLNARVKKFS